VRSTDGIKRLWLFQAAADIAAVATAYFTTLMLRFRFEWGEQAFAHLNQWLGVRSTGELGEPLEFFYQASAFRITLLLTITLCLLYALRDLYPGLRFLRKRPVAWNVLVANLCALGLFYAYFYLSRNVFHPRSFFATVIFLNFLFCLAFRAGAERILQWLRDRYGMARPGAVLVGCGKEFEWLERYLREVEPHGVHLAATYTAGTTTTFEAALQETEALVRKHGASMIVTADMRWSMPQVMQFLQLTDRLDVAAKILSPHLEVMVARAGQPADMVHALPLVHFEAPSRVAATLPLRQACGLILAALGLALISPVLGLLALLIRATSRGPALFVQERMGVNRKPFQMFKFRTMYDHAEEMLAQMEEFNESGGGLFKIRRDPRITPAGRFLRRFSLDEMPQLLNVLRGEMVLVGPRPLPRRDFENYYEEWHYSRHHGMPGLTCLWQVSGRSDLDFHNMCVLDLYYLRNQSWLMDVKILLKTFWVVLFARGAY
jgi:exopolysaccharide biosynthesis polyprenyl glycosylphosphotransferase